MSIKQINFLNQSGYEVENDFFKALILPNEGSNLISLYDKKNKTEILRSPNTAEQYYSRRMVFGTPILMPPNRIEGAKFNFEERTYNLELNRIKGNERNHIHGFVHDKAWKVVNINHTNSELTLSLHSNDFEHITNQYPHDFILTMKYKLTKTGIQQFLYVENNDDKNVPLGLGYHTNFYFDDNRSRLQIELGKQWELAENCVPTGELLEHPLKEKLIKGMELTGLVLDNEYLMTQNKTAIIEHPHLGLKVKYIAGDSFNHWVLFNADGTSNMLSVEPYSWITNAPNLNLPYELTGLYVLKPGETREFKTEIYVEDL